MMLVEGKERKYILHVGRTAKTPMPLVLQLHGRGSSGRQHQLLTGMGDYADRHGFAVVYPDGLARQWRMEDLPFLRALIEKLVKDGTADPRRIYASGMSNGSAMAQVLALEMSQQIAAIGSVGAMPPKFLVEHAKPPCAVPMFYMHGTADMIVGYDGSLHGEPEVLVPPENLVRWWARINGCSAKHRVEDLPDIANDGTTVQRWTFDGPAPVVYYRVEGGGHTWAGAPPGQTRIFGRVSRDFSATEVIWEFLSRWSLAAPGQTVRTIFAPHTTRHTRTPNSK